MTKEQYTYMNDLFELKIKELKCLNKKFDLHKGILIVYEKNYPVVLGCDICYMKKPIATISGYKIDGGELVNFYEKYKEHCTIPVEMAINCWLCSKCGRLFKELLPEMEVFEIQNVSL